MKTKTTNIIQRLSLFLLALVLTMPTWAQGGSGNESETITIASKEDWKAFCDRVDRGETTLNAKMTADVDLGEDTWQVGASRNYSGTFDGQGHTLTVNWNSAFSFLLAHSLMWITLPSKTCASKGISRERGNWPD